LPSAGDQGTEATGGAKGAQAPPPLPAKISIEIEISNTPQTICVGCQNVFVLTDFSPAINLEPPEIDISAVRLPTTIAVACALKDKLSQPPVENASALAEAYNIR
jgi:hypothetical protein